MVPPPNDGRVFRQEVRPGLADCSPTGRIRLDALARWLQDLAYADVEQAGVADRAVWVVRRARVRVDVEMEFRSPAQPGQKLVLRHGDQRWIVGEDGETHASLRLNFVAG